MPPGLDSSENLMRPLDSPYFPQPCSYDKNISVSSQDSQTPPVAHLWFYQRLFKAGPRLNPTARSPQRKGSDSYS